MEEEEDEKHHVDWTTTTFDEITDDDEDDVGLCNPAEPAHMVTHRGRVASTHASHLSSAERDPS